MTPPHIDFTRWAESVFSGSAQHDPALIPPESQYSPPYIQSTWLRRHVRLLHLYVVYSSCQGRSYRVQPSHLLIWPEGSSNSCLVLSVYASCVTDWKEYQIEKQTGGVIGRHVTDPSSALSSWYGNACGPPVRWPQLTQHGGVDGGGKGRHGVATKTWRQTCSSQYR